MFTLMFIELNVYLIFNDLCKVKFVLADVIPSIKAHLLVSCLSRLRLYLKNYKQAKLQKWSIED
ncbi:hypothetical protein LguiA_011397 [Lonicera macranthoides]